MRLSALKSIKHLVKAGYQAQSTLVSMLIKYIQDRSRDCLLPATVETIHALLDQSDNMRDLLITQGLIRVLCYNLKQFKVTED